VLFANSRDIVWYRSPKLHQGQSGVLLLHEAGEHDGLGDAPPASYEVVDPLDFHPHERRPDVERIVDPDADTKAG
jgi:hypothetical protein